jgi:hypothetical protein
METNSTPQRAVKRFDLASTVVTANAVLKAKYVFPMVFASLAVMDRYAQSASQGRDSSDPLN